MYTKPNDNITYYFACCFLLHNILHVDFYDILFCMWVYFIKERECTRWDKKGQIHNISGEFK